MTVHPDNADGLQYANFRATDSEFNFMLIDSEDTIGIVCREMSDAERTHLRNRIVAALCYCHGKPTMDLVMQSQRVAGPGQAALIVNRHPAIDVNEAGDLTNRRGDDRHHPLRRRPGRRSPSPSPGPPDLRDPGRSRRHPHQDR